MADSLAQCEKDVELARQRLSDDLDALSSPDTLSAFTADVKNDAIETKDELVAQAKVAIESRVSDMMEELKAKAAANPTAALMIGAGLGWYLLRHPPITTALVGYGLFSLLRTPAHAQPNAKTQDYLRQGHERLSEQVRDLTERGTRAVSSMAADAGEKVASATGDLFVSARDAATRLSHDVGDQLASSANSVKDQVESMITKAGGTTANLGNEARQRAGHVTERVSAGLNDVVKAANSTLPDGDARDRMLLGVAGLAVAAAVGVAWQKRFAEES